MMIRSMSVVGLVVFVVAGCATSGPTDLLDELNGAADASCMRGVVCLEQALEYQQQGRVDEAEPYLLEACRYGEISGCRHLGNLYAMGALGTPERESAAALFEWGCEQGDGPSCHSLGELYRVGLEQGADVDRSKHYFSKACNLGELAGCHDEAVVSVVGREADGDVEEAAVAVFKDVCQRQWSVGCVNLAYMKAAGRGTAREHREAEGLFEAACREGDDGWTRHPLGSAFVDEEIDPDLYAVTEYRPQVACDQLEVLVVGGFEERIIGAFAAETRELGQCYDEVRGEGQNDVGRLTMEAYVTAHGDGVSPRVVDDELGIDEVRQCVDQVLSRHLQDQRGDDGQYRIRWTASFLHPPQRDDDEKFDELPPNGCDTGAIQQAVADVFPSLHQCGQRHTERHSGDPGAVVARWKMDSTGTVQDVKMSSTIKDLGIVECLDRAIHEIEIPAFESGVCEVQVPLSFSDGEELHFSVIGGR